ncbi:MAG TPA: sulfite exporter TauE/SafE family protein [Ignavibacteriales bacterium]|nr:sulfite exporter TauE/SafE family protein [Ignavibacteriales bacterium]
MDFNSALLMAVIFSFVLAFVFSMFGQGGGSVYSPLLILLGFPVLISTSTSLVLNLITSVSAGYVFYRNKMIDMKASFMFVPGIVLGAFLGGVFAKQVNQNALLWLFVFFLLILGARMIYTYWQKGNDTDDETIPVLSASKYVLIVVFSFAVGIISGLLGVGGGVLIVPFMTYILKYPMKSAAGSSHLIISFSALAGIIGHAASHKLDYPLIAVAGIAVLIGGNLGARFSLRIKPKMIKAGLGFIMWALAGQILIKLVTI